MAHITYAALLSMVRILQMSGIDDVWPDFLRVYDLPDMGTEPTAGGISPPYFRMEELKRLYSETDPGIQQFLHILAESILIELVDPRRDAMARTDRFSGQSGSRTELERLEQELALGEYQILEEGEIRPVAQEPKPEDADIDAVTKIPVRRYFDERSAAVWEKCLGAGVPIAALFVDTDNFKSINDKISHKKGDEVLRRIAQEVRKAVQFKGLVGRWGQGDEIVTILRNLTEDEAHALGERIRAQIEGQNLAGVGVTVTIGVASTSTRVVKTVGGLLDMADEALRIAKEKGKNRVRKYSEPAE